MHYNHPETNIIIKLIRFIEDTREEEYLEYFIRYYLLSTSTGITLKYSLEFDVLRAYVRASSNQWVDFIKTLKEIENIKEIPDGLKSIIKQYIDMLAFPDVNASDYKDFKNILTLDINSLIPKLSFLNDLFYPLELILLKIYPNIEEILLNMLNIYCLEYTKDTTAISFRPGSLTYNQYEYDKHSIKESDYPHNTIIEIKYPSIRDVKTGEIIRKAKVVVSFEY